GGGDRLDIVDALGGLNEGVDKNRLACAMSGFELGEQLIEIVNVPCPFDLGQHDRVKLVANGGNNLRHIIQRPPRVECVDARPQSGGAEIASFRHGMEAGARRFFGVNWNGVFEIAQHDVNLGDKFRNLAADLFDMRRNEVNHPLQP